MNLTIVGTGGLAKEIAGLLLAINRLTYGLNIYGFVSEKSQPETFFMGYPILGDDEWLAEQPPRSVILAVSNPLIKAKLHEKFKHHNFPTILHPNIDRLGYIEFGEGVMVMPQVVIETDVKIKNHVFIGSHTFIGHDAIIEDYCTITYGVGLSGKTIIKEKTFIGTNSVIIDGKTIGKEVTLGAGVVITKNVPDGETWIGVPGRKK